MTAGTVSSFPSPRRGEPDGPAGAGSPAPLYVTEEQVALIEGWAANAATHGTMEAWGVLSQCLLWRVNS